MPSIFEEFISQFSPPVQELAAQARDLLRSALPEAAEMVDPPSRIVAYGYSPKYTHLVVAIAPYKNDLNLIFARGAKLADPDHLLAGTGKRARHVKIRTAEDLRQAGLAKLLTEADRQTPRP